MTLGLVVGIFVWLLGLCVGSFLNVVVYRLPRDLSINRPSRSFCPRCNCLIPWYDNIPLVSWLALRARCRQCAAPISVQYPLVEGATGLAFVLVYYLLFVARARVSLGPLDHLTDGPLLLAWLVLVAALITCAAMDLVSYMVDVRITHVAVVAGLVLYAGWPRALWCAPLAAEPAGAAGVATLIASVFLLWLTVWRVPDTEADQEPEDAAEAVGGSAPPTRAAVVGGRIAIFVLVGLTLWLLAEITLHSCGGRHLEQLRLPAHIEAYDATGTNAAAGLAPHLVLPAAVVALFALMVLAGGQPRPVDSEVEEAIEEEHPRARRMALGEFAWLAVPLAAGIATFLVVTYVPTAGAAWRRLAEWSPGGSFCPVGGLTYAAYGMIVGAAAGWALRIVFTLIFGREALGVGDIYILAAAGAAAGWDIALLGLLLAVGLAIAGVVCGLLLKRAVIIPFGPWLALGLVVALWLNKPAAGLAREYYSEMKFTWSRRPDICLVAAGLMLVGSGVAIVLARLVRRLIEPRKT